MTEGARDNSRLGHSAHRTPDQEPERDSSANPDRPRRSWVAIVTGLAVAVGIIGVAVAALGAQTPFQQVVGTGLLIEAAAAMCGALLGFLFGIPRSRQRPTPDDGADANPANLRRYEVNTNLEQISDWLTKILVGVGLVQIGAIGSRLGDLIDTAAAGMGSSTSLAGALLVYSLTAGFLGGYLVTRTVLTQTFSRYDALLLRVNVVEQRAARAEEVSTRVAVDVQALAAVDTVLAGEEDAHDEQALLNLFRTANPSILAQIYARASSLRRANWRESKDVMARCIPVFRALCQNDTARRYHRNYGQLGFALKDQQDPDWIGAEKALTDAIAIRDATGVSGFRLYEFNRALCRIARDTSKARTEPTLRQQIIADLKEAQSNSTIRRSGLIERDQSITSWLARNGLELSELA